MMRVCEACEPILREQYAKKPAPGQGSLFDEEKHPRASDGESPGGRGTSKRGQAAATKALGEKLFGPGGATRAQIVGPRPTMSKADRVAHIRSLAKMAGKSQAKKLNAEADALEKEDYSLLTSQMTAELYRRAARNR